MTVIKAAAVQISPVLYSRDGTIDRVVQKIIELGRKGVQFADSSGATRGVLRWVSRSTSVESAPNAPLALPW